MSRLVKAKPKNNLQATVANVDGQTPSKQYLERVAKYVPAEIIAAYTAINGALSGTPTEIKYWVLIVSFGVCAIFTPIYFGIVSERNNPSKVTQQIVSFFAFLIWAYSTTNENSIFSKEYWNWYYSGIATGLLVLFSLISGFIVPKEK